LHGGRCLRGGKRVAEPTRLRQLLESLEERFDGRGVVGARDAVAYDDDDGRAWRMLGELTCGRSITGCCIEHEGRAKQQRHGFDALLTDTNSSGSNIRWGFSFHFDRGGSRARQFREGRLDVVRQARPLAPVGVLHNVRCHTGTPVFP
jgi:hypothetical protein